MLRNNLSLPIRPMTGNRAGAAIGLAGFAVAGHAVRVARMNPVHALRGE
jgi:hypothetical protein